MITSYVASELAKVRDFDPGLQAKVNWDIISLVNSLKEQGHLANEGGNNTGLYMVNVLSRLLCMKPITPLTGEDSEWTFSAEQSTETKHVFINLRCPSVAKEIDTATNQTKSVDYDAVVISSDGGVTWWERSKCSTVVHFPYLPPVQPTILYVREKEGAESEYEILDNEDEIIALRNAALEEAAKETEAECECESGQQSTIEKELEAAPEA